MALGGHIRRWLSPIAAAGPWSSKSFGPPKRGVWDRPTDPAAGFVKITLAPPAPERLVAPELCINITARELEASLFPGIKPRVVAELAFGRYYQPTCAVIDRQDQLCYDFTQDWSAARLHNMVFQEIRLPRVRRLAGRMLLLDVRSQSQNYFHWLIEAVPKLDAVIRAGYDVKSFDGFLVSKPTAPFHRDTFSAVGIDPARLVDTAAHRHVECESLVAVSDSREYLYEDACAFLRGPFCAQQPPLAEPARRRRLYISRRERNWRIVENEDALLPLLTEWGFTALTLTGLSLWEQREMFAAAECVIAPHGAALANIVFARPRTLVVELHFPYRTKGLYWRIASAAGLRYAAVRGQPGRVNPTNLILLPEQLQTILATMLHRPDSAVSPV